MAEFVTLTIGTQNFTIKVIDRTHSHLLQVTGENITLFFEPDEEGSYRVIKMPWQKEQDIKKVDVQLIQEIMTLLNTIHQ